MPPTPTSPILSAKARPPDMRISISARNRLFCVGLLQGHSPSSWGSKRQQGDQIRHEVLRPDWERADWVPIASRWVPGDGGTQSVWSRQRPVSEAGYRDVCIEGGGYDMRKVRVGLISFAHGHQMGWAGVFAARPDVEIVAAWDDDEQRGRERAQRLGVEFVSDLDALLSRSDVDAVTICSENSKHAAHAVKAAEAGKHI